MSAKENVEKDAPQQFDVPASEAKNLARRKLLGKGVSAVAVTLASKPVLAWHCRTPSMWGSMAMNPATSLMKNADHGAGVLNESWYISNWKDNTERSQVADAGKKKPWDELFSKVPFPSRQGVFFTDANSARNQTPTTGAAVLTITNAANQTRYLRTDLYTVSAFCSDVGISCNASGSVKRLFNNPSTFNAHIVVAQLHEKLLAGVRECVDSELDLARVATSNGSVTINGISWTQEMFIDYFEANWIAVAGGTFSSGWYGTQSANSVNPSVKQYIYEDATQQDKHYFTFK